MRGWAIFLAVVLAAGRAAAQAPVPLTAPNPAAGLPPQTMTGPQSMPPLAPQPVAPQAPIPMAMPAPPPAAPASAPVTRDFCGQSVPFSLADAAAAPAQYRGFIGIWSDAAWTPQLCAALVVETVDAGGNATIVYAYGPQGSNSRVPGGVLHGTGIIRDGQLRFQNSDGSQYAFAPYYADLNGSLATPKGQTYRTVFKKSY